MISGVPRPESHAEDAARGHAPQGVDHLLTAAHRVVPRREPHGDAIRDCAREAEHIARQESRENDRKAGGGEQITVARNRVHGEEQRRDQERGTQVALQEEERERHHHTGQHRQQVFEARHLDPFRKPGRSGRSSRSTRSSCQRSAKYPARNKTSRMRMTSAGWNPSRFTLASLPVGPLPNRISAATRERAEQPHVTEAAGQAVIIEHAGDAERDQAEHDALHEIGESERIAQTDRAASSSAPVPRRTAGSAPATETMRRESAAPSRTGGPRRRPRGTAPTKRINCQRYCPASRTTKNGLMRLSCAPLNSADSIVGARSVSRAPAIP
jgi:hypothetical protein